MSTALTVGEVLARLEKQGAFHREQAERHARQEAYSREQKEHHTQQADEAGRHLAAFREISAPAVERARAPLPEVAEPPALAPGERPGLTRLVELVVQDLDSTQPFGRSRVLEELERRFGGVLRKKPEPRHVSMVLQRLAQSRTLHQIRRGRPYWEALYVREKPKEE